MFLSGGVGLLQNMVLGPLLSFYEMNDDFVEILDEENLHTVVVSIAGCQQIKQITMIVSFMEKKM